MSKYSPLVSIITPSYNSSEFISETISSVLAQSLTDWEMIIVDDCSSDTSTEVIQSFINQDSRIKLIKLGTNSGAAVARNIGIEAAKGRYIAFLDSDDLWLPNKLEKQLAFMQKNNYSFTYTAYDKINEAGDVIGHVGVPERVSYHTLLKTCLIGCLTVIYDTEYLGKVKMPLIRRRQDFGLWLKLLKKVDYAYGLQDTLGLYRVRDGAISSNKLTTSVYTWKLYREVEGLSFITSSYYFLHYSIRGALRTHFPRLARILGVLD